MIPRRYVIAGLGIGLAIALAVILRPNRSDDGNRAAEPAANVSSGDSVEPGGEFEGEVEEGRGGAAEAQEEAEVTERRLEALAEARAKGDFGKKIAATTAPATGWVGSRVMSSTWDDWEPAVATDPKAPYIYLLTTRYGDSGLRDALPEPVPRPDDLERQRSHLERPGSALRVPALEGAVRPDHRGRPEYGRRLRRLPERRPPQRLLDRLHEVDRPRRDMDRARCMSTATSRGRTSPRSPRAPPGKTSTSHGTGRRAATFTSASPTTSARRGRSRSSPATSATTTPTTPASSATGRSSSRRSSIVYSGLRNVSGEVWHHAVISRDKGTTWQNVIVAKVPLGENCIADGCGPDFYTGQTSVVGDAPGHLVFAYEGPTTDAGRSASTSRRRRTRAARGAPACRSP